jgi:hypothetical protein
LIIWRSSPDKIRVLGLQPVPASAVAIEAPCPLRHDTFEGQFARLLEHDGALGGESFAEQDPVPNVRHEPLERLAPRLERPQAQVVAIDAQKIEGDGVASAPPRLVMSA